MRLTRVYSSEAGSRGHLGGVSRSTHEAALILDACGFDVVLIETVGVGQSEVDIIKIADTVVLVLVPGMGDDVQIMKAGIMEIADTFVVNKADKEGEAQGRCRCSGNAQDAEGKGMGTPGNTSVITEQYGSGRS